MFLSFFFQNCARIYFQFEIPHSSAGPSLSRGISFSNLAIYKDLFRLLTYTMANHFLIISFSSVDGLSVCCVSLIVEIAFYHPHSHLNHPNHFHQAILIQHHTQLSSSIRSGNVLRDEGGPAFSIFTLSILLV